ncbi:hypothetical protein OG21DRAFT_941059 [Imleria badia]|nr:hypothetical protein OG21DRAFT_941059 [Imleria badia]
MDGRVKRGGLSVSSWAVFCWARLMARARPGGRRAVCVTNRCACRGGDSLRRGERRAVSRWQGEVRVDAMAAGRCADKMLAYHWQRLEPIVASTVVLFGGLSILFTSRRCSQWFIGRHHHRCRLAVEARRSGLQPTRASRTSRQPMVVLSPGTWSRSLSRPNRW